MSVSSTQEESMRSECVCVCVCVSVCVCVCARVRVLVHVHMPVSLLVYVSVYVFVCVCPCYMINIPLLPLSVGNLVIVIETEIGTGIVIVIEDVIEIESMIVIDEVIVTTKIAVTGTGTSEEIGTEGTEETGVEIGAGAGIGTTEDGIEIQLPDDSCRTLLCCEVGIHF